MDRNDYLRSLNVCGKLINLGIDDYGQCFYIEYINDDGNLENVFLGTYNAEYLEEIYGMLDPRYKHLYDKNRFYKEGIKLRPEMPLAQLHPEYGEEPLSIEEEKEYNSYLELFKKIYTGEKE